MKVLSIDIETYSTVKLTQSGVYRYVEDSKFEILLFAYAIDDEPVQIIDLSNGEDIPFEVKSALFSVNVIKSAYNANFERTCLSKYLNINMPPDQWRCTAVQALMLGLPGNLDGVGKVLIPDVQKDTAGKNLIRYFSVPCKPTKTNGNRERNLPHHDKEKWERFKAYCIKDVEVERAIRRKLDRYKIPDFEQKLWQLDQLINDRGIHLDTDLVAHAIACNNRYQKKLFEEARRLTRLENPNSISQLKNWLEENGIEVKSLSKDEIPELIRNANNQNVKRVLNMRMEMSKTSIKKYQAMERTLCKDGRVRGLLQFYGANRTGRWAGRLVQVQNLPRNNLGDLDIARALLKIGQYETLEFLFDNLPDVLSQLVRTAFIPSKGSTFLVSDFSAIEARVIAWLAGERWRLDVFKSHGKIYEASAAQMFNVPVDSITKSNPLRQKGKIAELALGYQGGKGALIQMGALQMGLSEEELPELVNTWRKANPNIIRLWYEIEKAAIEAVREKRAVYMQHNLVLFYESGFLFIQLPSGRKLAYAIPKLQRNERFNKDELSYEGIESGKWSKITTYGGKLTENIVQAIARDCLAESLIRLDDRGYNIVMHVHDEVVLDVKDGSLHEVEQIMSEPIPWAKGLPLKAEGFETEYYRKD
jgi:DNA polymerase bacteriophage-type